MFRSKLAHSYRLFVSFDVCKAGEAASHVHSQTGQLVFEEPHQTEQHTSQEQVLPLSLTVRWPEPAHSQEGAQGLGWQLVPHKDLS